MNNKLFVGVLIGMLVVGASVGGAFAGGVAYGRGQEDATPAVVASALPSPGGSRLNIAPAGGVDITDLRQRFQSGDITPDELEQFRNRFQDQDGGGRQGGFGGFGGFGGRGGDGFRFGGGGGLVGTVESVVDGVLTVNTQQGPLQATLVADTVIRSIVDVSVEDLTIDTSVTVTVHTTENGLIEASSVLITPDGFAFGGDRRFFDGSRDDSHQPQ